MCRPAQKPHDEKTARGGGGGRQGGQTLAKKGVVEHGLRPFRPVYDRGHGLFLQNHGFQGLDEYQGLEGRVRLTYPHDHDDQTLAPKRRICFLGLDCVSDHQGMPDHILDLGPAGVCVLELSSRLRYFLYGLR